MTSPSSTISKWPARFALATLLAAIPLLALGGTVTSLDAGMAIDGWWTLEPGRGDHFLLFYPLEKWFRDIGTFSEHSHRLFGVLVGNLAIATVIATWLATKSKTARWTAMLGLLSVCFQGLIGGTRVLENSPSLAFLHGALAQIVFAILAAGAVILSPRFQSSQLDESDESIDLARSANFAIIVAYGTIFAGAWLRHAYSYPALGVHILFVFMAVALAVRLAVLAKIQSKGRPEKVKLRRASIAIHSLLGLQVLLGVASFWVVFMLAPNSDERIHHSAYPTMHVLIGACVLAQLVATRLWSRRTLAPSV
jgi:heme a synthase